MTTHGGLPFGGRPFVWTACNVAMLLVFIAARGAASPLLFVGDFESGSIYPFITQACCPNSITVVKSPARHGGFSARFELNYDDDLAAGGKRAEVLRPYDQPHDEMNTDYWYGFSVLIPRDWVVESWPEIIAQWHDSSLLGLSPPLSLRIESDTFILNSRRDGGGVNGDDFWVGPVILAKWVDWVFHVKWSSGPDGMIEVWQNGQLLVSRNGPSIYSGNPIGPYFKMGLYKWLWNRGQYLLAQKRLIFFDEFREADHTGSYQVVAPGPPMPPVGLSLEGP